MRRQAAKKTIKRRADIARPFNGGEWTAARMTSFIKSALRGARWPQKYKAVATAYEKNGINPKTGRKCKLHRCAICRDLFPQNGVHADHIVPVVGPEGFVSWDRFIQRLFVDAEGFRVLCKECHGKVTKEEQEERRKQ
jgi:5-methylcytosine-specific restriction endonuclease McrA